MTAHYSIEFHSYWHCGSGLSAGADVDSLPVKDKNGLPFVPGKTIKGLLRDTCTAIQELRGGSLHTIYEIFGEPSGNSKGIAFFSNAVLGANEYDYISMKQLGEYMFTSISSTQIEDGTAKDFSLRRIEVVVPCCLYGTIDGLDEKHIHLIEDGAKMIKRLGLGRHRGLGRCSIKIERR